MQTDDVVERPSMEHEIGNVPLVVLKPGERLRVYYTNWRGSTAIREIALDGAPFWGKTEWHPKPQWLIAGTDVVSNEHRVWAIKDMRPLL